MISHAIRIFLLAFYLLIATIGVSDRRVDSGGWFVNEYTTVMGIPGWLVYRDYAIITGSTLAIPPGITLPQPQMQLRWHALPIAIVFAFVFAQLLYGLHLLLKRRSTHYATATSPVFPYFLLMICSAAAGASLANVFVPAFALLVITVLATSAWLRNYALIVIVVALAVFAALWGVTTAAHFSRDHAAGNFPTWEAGYLFALLLIAGIIGKLAGDFMPRRKGPV